MVAEPSGWRIHLGGRIKRVDPMAAMLGSNPQWKIAVLYLYVEEESNSALDAAFVCWPYFRQVLRLQAFSLIRGGSQRRLPWPFHIDSLCAFADLVNYR